MLTSSDVAAHARRSRSRTSPISPTRSLRPVCTGSTGPSWPTTAATAAIASSPAWTAADDPGADIGALGALVDRRRPGRQRPRLAGSRVRHRAGPRRDARSARRDGRGRRHRPRSSRAVPDARDRAHRRRRRSPQIVDEMLTDSNNETAELLTREIGVRRAHDGTTEAGVRAIAARCSRASASRSRASTSTTARASRTRIGSPAARSLGVVALGRRSRMRAILDGLAVAGRTGTLATRFAGGPLVDRLRAKTGHISGVVGLAGVDRSERPVRVRRQRRLLHGDGRGAAGRGGGRHRQLPGRDRAAGPGTGARTDVDPALRNLLHRAVPADETLRSPPTGAEWPTIPSRPCASSRSSSSRTPSRRRLDPLKGIARYVGFGLAGAVLLGSGVSFLAIGRAARHAEQPCVGGQRQLVVGALPCRRHRAGGARGGHLADQGEDDPAGSEGRARWRSAR